MRNIAATRFANLSSFECLNSKGAAIQRHELDLIGLAIAMDMDDYAHVPSLQSGCRNVLGQYH